MTNVTFPRKEIEKEIKLTKEVIEKISLFGTPLEKVTPKELEIEIFPNRPDLISMQGWLRGFKAFLGKQAGLKNYKIKKSGDKLIVEKSLPKEWPYAIACIVRGLKFDDEKIKEVIDVQEKLGMTMMRKRKKGGIGVYPLEKINFPIRFKGLEPNKIKFKPLEYDQEITGRQILSKHPTGREYAHICEEWDKFPVFVDNKGTIMSMPPIINSHNVGKIDETTKDVFVEATGPNLNTLQKAIRIITTTLADAGGEIYSIECTQQNGEKSNVPDLTPEKMHISLENTNKLLGLNLKESDLHKLLPKMGYEYKNHTVQIPAWRTDILHEVDIIEDITIAYGYDKLEPEIPNVSTIGEESKESKIKSKISEILIGLNLIETSSYHLIKQRDAELARLENKIELEDSKTEYKFLRPNLLIPSLRILTENKDRDYPQNTFEIGTVFAKDPSQETGIKEQENLIITLSPTNFTKMKQILTYLTSQLNIKYSLEPSTNKNLIEGRTATIKVNEKTIGYMGELHPETLRTWGIKMPAAVIEISLEEVFKSLN